MGFINGIADVKRPAPFEEDSIRGEFARASEAKVPKTADGIVRVLNNTSSRRGESGEIRGHLVTALSQFPEFWTEGKKRMEAEKAAKKAPANDDAVKPVAMSHKKRHNPQH